MGTFYVYLCEAWVKFPYDRILVWVGYQIVPSCDF